MLPHMLSLPSSASPGSLGTCSHCPTAPAHPAPVAVLHSPQLRSQLPSETKPTPGEALGNFSRDTFRLQGWKSCLQVPVAPCWKGVRWVLLQGWWSLVRCSLAQRQREKESCESADCSPLSSGVNSSLPPHHHQQLLPAPLEGNSCPFPPPAQPVGYRNHWAALATDGEENHRITETCPPFLS